MIEKEALKASFFADIAVNNTVSRYLKSTDRKALP